jgi:uncharacterized protein YcfJ
VLLVCMLAHLLLTCTNVAGTAVGTAAGTAVGTAVGTAAGTAVSTAAGTARNLLAAEKSIVRWT